MGRLTLLGGGGSASTEVPAWVLEDAVLDLDAWENQAYGSAFHELTCVHNSIAYAENVDGTLTSFAINTLKRTDKGILIEESRTNVVLHNRDLTNAVWTKSNITAVKDQTGPDGVTNSASKITATAGNGTVLQAITLASSARYQTAYVKRITGSGIVEMTTDNGATWTAVTVTAGWTRVSIPVQTLANPTVGFRIVTSGDAVAVDFLQNEGNAGGDFFSSPIATTTEVVNRGQDSVSLPTSAIVGFSATAGTIYLECLVPYLQAANRSFASLSDETDNERFEFRVNADDISFVSVDGGVLQVNIAVAGVIAAATVFKVAVAWTVDDFAAVLDGGAVGTDAAGTLPTFTTLRLGAKAGGTEVIFGYVRRVAYWNTRLANATLQSLTT